MFTFYFLVSIPNGERVSLKSIPMRIKIIPYDPDRYLSIKTPLTPLLGPVDQVRPTNLMRPSWYRANPCRTLTRPS